jgi:prenyl protein peptidase
MGFPRFWGRVSAGDTVMGPDVGVGKRSEDGNATLSNDGRLNVMWTIAYYALLIVGAMAWRQLLWPLTQSESTLTKF